MSKNTLLTSVLSLALLLGLSGLASAQFSIGFSKHGKHKSFGLNIGSHGLSGHVSRGHGHGHGHGHIRIHRPHRHVHCHSCVRQTPGFYRTVSERVWVAGCARQQWVQPVYRTVCDPCGSHRRVLVRAGFYQTVQGAGHWDVVNRRVWVPGQTQYVCGF
ncbi:MAG: hypothetical protein CMJ83_22160 [Planctomycetes bacterium]|nr:hypothetical protein [Planctomycetota bacterium]